MNPIKFLTILFIGLCYSQSAAAYLDPGAGSFILQMLIAGNAERVFQSIPKANSYPFTAEQSDAYHRLQSH